VLYLSEKKTALVPPLSSSTAPALTVTFAVRTPAGKRLAVPGLVHAKRPAAEFFAVELRYRVLRVFHVDKAETARAMAPTVGDDFCGANGAMLLEMLLELVLSGIVRKIAYEDLFYQDFLLLWLTKDRPFGRRTSSVQ
jgi:hypothetical protein